MDGKMLARLGAVVFVAVAITATAIEMNRKEEASAAWPSGRATQAQIDPLRDELIRCQSLGEAGPRDAACLRAWAENRNRFLAPGARPMERLPEPPPNAGSREIPDNPIRRESAPQLHEAR
jgi:conjugative transfer region protein TrbK